MKTLKSFMDKVHESERTAFDLAKKEIIQVLDIIAEDIMSGKTTVYHGKVLLDIRHSMMTASEQKIDYEKNESELLKMSASTLGQKGGISKSDAKKKSSAENGKLGGRPKGSGKKKDKDAE